MLDVACRNSEVVSAFVIKPFRCEGERRALADRTIARLQFVESYVDRHERGRATIQTLDNESLIRTQGQRAFGEVAHHWADLIERHIETSFVGPVEAMIEAVQMTRTATEGPMNRIPESEVPALGVVPPSLRRVPSSRPSFPPSAFAPPRSSLRSKSRRRPVLRALRNPSYLSGDQFTEQSSAGAYPLGCP